MPMPTRRLCSASGSHCVPLAILQQEEADRAAAAAYAVEVAQFSHVPIGAAHVLLIDVRPEFSSCMSDAIAFVAPLLSAAIGVGFTVGAFGTTVEPSSLTWTLQRSGGGLTPLLQHQLRKIIAQTVAAVPQQFRRLKVTCC